MACLTHHWRWNLFVCITLLPLVAPLVRDARADEPAAPPNRETLISAALARPINCEYNQTPLADVIKDLEKKLGITVALEIKALDEVGIGSDTPITIQLTNISAASALRHLLRRTDPTLTFSIRDGALTITTREEAEENLRLRYYDISELAGEISTNRVFHVLQRSSPFSIDGDAPALVEILTKTVEPDSWDEVGGPGSIEVRDGIMAVSQTDEIHEQVDAVLTALRKAFAAHQTQRNNLTPIDFSTAARKAAKGTIEKLLDVKGTDLTFQQTPLADVVRAYSEATKKTVLLDIKALDEIGVAGDTPVTHQLKGLTLRQEIRWLLKRVDPTLTYSIRDEALLFTTREAAEENLSTFLYPVWDLLLDTPGHGYDSLIGLITRMIEPDTWDEVGGPGSVAETEFGCLIVSQTDLVHEKVQELLAELRTVQQQRNASVTQPAETKDPYVVVLYHLRTSLTTTSHSLRRRGYSNTPAPPGSAPPTEPSTEASHRPKPVEEIMPLVQQLIEPASWKADEVVMRPLGKDLVIRHRVSVHRQIGQLLQSLLLLENQRSRFF